MPGYRPSVRPGDGDAWRPLALLLERAHIVAPRWRRECLHGGLRGGEHVLGGDVANLVVAVTLPGAPELVEGWWLPRRCALARLGW
jgi:hypothetical protein